MGESISLLIGVGIGLFLDQMQTCLKVLVERWRHPQRTVEGPTVETVRFTAPERRRFYPEDYDEPPACTHGGHPLVEGQAFYAWTVPANPIIGSPEGELAVCEGHAYTGMGVPHERAAATDD